MWPTAWLSSNHADVLTFSMISMLINIQVRALDLSGDSVFRHVERHDLTSHQHKQLAMNCHKNTNDLSFPSQCYTSALIAKRNWYLLITYRSIYLGITEERRSKYENKAKSKW